MRDLDLSELKFVSGASSSPSRPSGSGCSPCPPAGKTKNNNGYGNGAESGPAPGRSGSHNPTLVDQNTGNKSHKYGTDR